jgi:hypothetical protein
MASKIDSIHFSVSFLILFSVVFLFAAPATATLEDHIIKTESGFYYTVQKGDTLWDLSKQFSDSPWEWPGLWSNNPQITNPHLIYPGQKLLIFKKDWEGKEKKQEVQKPAVLSAVEPPPPPPTPKPKTYKCLGIDSIGYIRKEPVPPTGNIFTTWNKYNLTSNEEEIFIRPTSDSSPMSVGDKFFIYRTLGPIMDSETNAKIGYQHYIEGIARITRLEPDYAIAIVEQTYREIRINDPLMPYIPTPTEFPIKDGLSGIVGKIIKPEEEKNLVGQDEVVFIDKGQEDGIEPGQEYSIYVQETAIIDPKYRTPKTLYPKYVGSLIILRTEPETSTAFIVVSLKDIQPGNLVGNIKP